MKLKKSRKLPNIFHKERKLSFLSNKKFRIMAVLFLFVGAAAVIAVFAGFRGAPDEKPPEGKQTETVREEKTGEEKADAADLGDLENHLASDFIRTLRGDQYVVRYRTTTVYKGGSFEAETTYAVSGGAIALVSGDRATIVRDGKVYMLNHSDQSMLSWNVTDADNLKRIDTTGMTYSGSSTDGGLVCEEYATGTTLFKFYFKGNQLVRLITGINGLDTAMDMIEVSAEVPGSLFVVPADYRNTSL